MATLESQLVESFEIDIGLNFNDIDVINELISRILMQDMPFEGLKRLKLSCLGQLENELDKVVLDQLANQS